MPYFMIALIFLKVSWIMFIFEEYGAFNIGGDISSESLNIYI